MEARVEPRPHCRRPIPRLAPPMPSRCSRLARMAPLGTNGWGRRGSAFTAVRGEPGLRRLGQSSKTPWRPESNHGLTAAARSLDWRPQCRAGVRPWRVGRRSGRTGGGWRKPFVVSRAFVDLGNLARHYGGPSRTTALPPPPDPSTGAPVAEPLLDLGVYRRRSGRTGGGAEVRRLQPFVVSRASVDLGNLARHHGGPSRTTALPPPLDPSTGALHCRAGAHAWRVGRHSGRTGDDGQSSRESRGSFAALAGAVYAEWWRSRSPPGT